MIYTIKENTSAQIVEKKSKFIAHVFYIKSEEEAEKIIKEINKKYHDARHNCYAYSITNEKETIERMSDDGEPSGTAGAPILNIIKKRNISNVLVIVTRYFGGILLGTGGLVKAYSQVAMDALDKTKIVQEEPGYVVKIQISYEDLEKFNYYCKNNSICIVEIEYQELINLKIELTNEERNNLMSNKQNLNFTIINFDILEQKNIRKNVDK